MILKNCCRYSLVNNMKILTNQNCYKFNFLSSFSFIPKFQSGEPKNNLNRLIFLGNEIPIPCLQVYSTY